MNGSEVTQLVGHMKMTKRQIL